MAIYKALSPVLELQAIRSVMHAQLAHVRFREQFVECEYERGYCEAKIAALDAAIEALSPGLLGPLQYKGPSAAEAFGPGLQTLIDFAGRK